MDHPLVSIVIPCYNAEPWIGPAVDSALAQTWPAVEIIVVDDGSRDGSADAVHRREGEGVRLIRQPNRGAAAARNAGLRSSTGAYVQFLDADDLLAADKIERQMAVLEAAGPAVLASAAWARFAGTPGGAEFIAHANWRDLSGIEFLQLHYEEGCMMHPAAWLAPRALLDRAGPWDESLSLNDDGEYFSRVALAAERIVFCPEARSYYRSALPGSLSGRRDPIALDSLYRSTELTLRHLLTADQTARTRSAAAYAWKWCAFELYPDAAELSRAAERNCRALGGSRRPFPAGGRFRLAARLLGWRLAKRLVHSP
jgi:glycosyltransferase involved in cell wall biosynthesis